MDEDFDVIPDPDGRLMKRFAERLEILKGYDPSAEVEKSRTFGFLDDARHPQFIDDVLVYLEKDGLNPEGCWARIPSMKSM